MVSRKHRMNNLGNGILKKAFSQWKGQRLKLLHWTKRFSTGIQQKDLKRNLAVEESIFVDKGSREIQPNDDCKKVRKTLYFLLILNSAVNLVSCEEQCLSTFLIDFFLVLHEDQFDVEMWNKSWEGTWQIRQHIPTQWTFWAQWLWLRSHSLCQV